MQVNLCFFLKRLRKREEFDDAFAEKSKTCFGNGRFAQDEAAQNRARRFVCCGRVAFVDGVSQRNFMAQRKSNRATKRRIFARLFRRRFGASDANLAGFRR